MKKIFEYQDYKGFIQAQIKTHKHFRGYRSRLAEAAGCQKSYLSQALRGDADLTPDHAAGLAEFWRLDELETKHFFLLVGLARAGTKRLRLAIERQIKELEVQRNDLAERFKQARAPSYESQGFYFTSWHWSAIHVLTSIPEFRTEQALAEKLQLSQALVKRFLSGLSEAGLVEEKEGKWFPSERNLHLHRRSVHLVQHLTNWRTRAVDHFLSAPGEGVHYSAVQAVSRSTAREIEALVRDVVEKSRTLAIHSPEEETVCINCDVFSL